LSVSHLPRAVVVEVLSVVSIGNIAAQTQAAQQASAQAQSGAGNPATMAPIPAGSVPSIAVGAASLAALIKGSQQLQQDAQGREAAAPGNLGVSRVSSPACWTMVASPWFAEAICFLPLL